MNSQADILVYGPDERLRLVVEVKNILGVSAEWAAQLRRNLLMHETLPNAPFFLIVTAEHLFVWKNKKTLVEPEMPDYEINTAEVFASYIDRFRISLVELSEPSLELVVISWIHDLIDSDFSHQTTHFEHNWVVDSGLYEALKHGSVITQVAL